MKKIFAFMTAAVMAATLVTGCASDETTENTGNSRDGTVIKIGTSGPMTGGNAVYGNAIANGLELAFEEINAKGGLQFEIKAQDDEGDPGKGMNAYNTLMDWGIQIMAGPTTSGVSIPVAAECASDGVFMLTPTGDDPLVIEAGDNIFPICFTGPNQGTGSADYIKQHNLGTNIGGIYDSSSPYSNGIYKNFAARAEKNGMNIVTTEAFTEDNKGDLSTRISRCQVAGCDLVFMPIYQ